MLMNLRERRKLYRIAHNYWGTDAQEDLLIEEVAELVKVIIKKRRSRIHSYVKYQRDDLLGEIADVEIMLEQVKIFNDIKDEEINPFKDRKLARLKERLK